jgi:hypothetical protein
MKRRYSRHRPDHDPFRAGRTTWSAHAATLAMQLSRRDAPDMHAPLPQAIF